MAPWTCAHVVVGVPFQERISSPTLRPAAAAGEGASASVQALAASTSAGTQAATEASVEV